jgi:GTP-binding protein
MFIDDMTLHLRAGRGGNGVVRWLHEKGKEFGGPSGGNGGKGGDIRVKAVRDIGILSSYRNVKEFEAGRGDDGGKNNRQGGVGSDVVIKLPVGSRITNLNTGYSIDLLNGDEEVLLLKGGRGGLGNAHFKSSTNIRPEESTEGEAGDESDFHIELLMVVDIGLIGLPNAGKSSLLNILTHAKSKVGDFPFTTLEPSLGDLYGLVIADIPGLIEGAAEGKGLGHKFLRHIERTKALVYCISSEESDPKAVYEIVRNELELYNKDIIKKPEIIVLTKVDLISEQEKEEKMKTLKQITENVLPVSILDDVLTKKFGEFLTSNFK